MDLCQGNQLCTFTCTFEDPNDVVNITEGHDVIVEDFADSGDRWFGGVVVSVTEETVGVGKNLTIQCNDWKLILERTTFSKDFDAGFSDEAVIDEIFNEAGLTEITTTQVVEVSPNIGEMTFRGTTLRSAIQTIATIAGAVWWVDPDKNLRYEAPATSTAAKDFSTSPNLSTTFPFYAVSRDRIMPNFNAVEVRGSRTLSDDVTDVYSGDGSRTFFKVAQDGIVDGNDYHFITTPPVAQGRDGRVIIEKNTGTDGSPTWTAQTVGLEGFDAPGTVDVLVNLLAQHIIWDSAPPNFANNSWRITGRYNSFSYASAEDDDLVTSMGRTFRHTINNPEIRTSEEALEAALAFLDEQGMRERVTFNTDEEDAVEVGDTVEITHSIFGLSAVSFEVENVRMKQLTEDARTYRVTAARLVS